MGPCNISSKVSPSGRMSPPLFLLLVLASSAQAENCLHPPPSESFSNSLYAGQWFEVGKYQTLGGSIFQVGAVCTEANFVPYDVVGGGDIGYSNRKNSPEGKVQNATGVLTALEVPGHFSQKLVFNGFEGPAADYNVIFLDEDSAIEYDCSQHILGLLDYCVHFMSRTPTMAEEKLEMLKALVLEMGLNSHNLDYHSTSQEGCW